MKTFRCIFILWFGVLWGEGVAYLQAQDTFKVKGRLIDKEKQVPLNNLYVHFKDFPEQGAKTNVQGDFELTLPVSLKEKNRARIYIQYPDIDVKIIRRIPLQAHKFFIIKVSKPEAYYPEGQANDLITQNEDPVATEQIELNTHQTDPNSDLYTSMNQDHARPENDRTKEPNEELEASETPASSNPKTNTKLQPEDFILDIEAALNRIKIRLTEEKQEIIARNQGIREDLERISQNIKQQVQITPEQRDRLTQKLAELQELLQENMRAYQRVQENTQVELERMQNVIAGQSKQVRLSQEKITRLLWIVLLLIASIFTVGYIAYRFRKQRNELVEKVAQIHAQNAQILEQKNRLHTLSEKLSLSLLEKETLLKEIHHRVKNNLQVISSLLNLQSNTISDPKAISAVRDGQSRVKSMALIHQKLYQAENAAQIDFQEYTEQLVNHLSSTFHSKTEQVTYEVQAKDIYLGIDTAIPLGLIINELVSNAYKYAFKEQKKGNILVKITKLDQKQYLLQVSDNGPGLPETHSLENAKTLGLKLVSILSRQLRGSVQVENKGGTHFKIKFEAIKSKSRTKNINQNSSV